MKRASLAFGVLVSSVILVDCGSKMFGPGEEVDSEASALIDASGAIVATQATSNVTLGETAGDFSVTDSGDASYTVPLWTPEGPMGMAPSLALTYNSSAGSGPLGVGFKLTGDVISMITRCKKTIPIDGDVGPIEVGGQTFCLDGKRLLLTSMGEYRTQEDDGSKITKLGVDSNGQPTGWKVYLRNGRVLTYGSKANFSTQLRGKIKITTCPNSNCDQAFLPQTADATLAWALEEVTDRAAQISGAVSSGLNNRMTISYTTLSSGTTNVAKYSADFDFKEMQIGEIDYGYGNGTTPNRKVVFTYGTTRDDASYTWVAGVPIMSTKRLDKIQMFGPSPTATQPLNVGLLKTYNLSYQTVLGVSGRARLNAISECDAASPTPVCKKFTQFNWENGSVVFRDIVDPTLRNIGISSPLQVLDYNGDGKADLMIRTGTTDQATDSSVFLFYTSQMGPELALPGSPDPTEPVHLESAQINSRSEYWIRNVIPVDIDHDGRSDLGLFAATSMDEDHAADLFHTFDITRNVGNGFVTQPPPSGGLLYDVSGANQQPAIYADLDGDGLPEEIGLSTTKGNNPNNNNNPDYTQLLYRLNHSGAPLGWRAPFREGNQGYTTQTSTINVYLGGGRYSSYGGTDYFPVDIDGSGRQSLLMQDSWIDVSQPPPYVNILNGISQMRAIRLTRAGAMTSMLPALAAFPHSPGSSHYIWLDVNGDGLPDAIDVPNDVTTSTTFAKCSDVVPDMSRIRINTGAGFKRYYGSFSEANAGTKYAINARTDAGVLVGDIDEDGQDDIVLTGKAIYQGATQRDKIQVLVASSGVTGNSHLVSGPPLKTLDNLEIPTVDAPIYRPSNNPAFDRETGVPAALGDFNGDGLLDIAVVRGSNLHFYIHQGKKADLLTSVDTGTGRHLAIKYAPSTDSSVYHRMRTGQQTPGVGQTGPWEQPAECQWPASCVTGGLWVVSRYDVTNDQNVNVGHHMTYAEGHSARNDKWLGFAERWDYDEPNGLVDVTTYDNRTQGTSEHYPFALLPAQQVHIAIDGAGPPGTANPRRFTTTNHYQEVANLFTSAAYSARLTDTTTVEEILNDTPPASVDYFALRDDYPTDELAHATTTFTYDQFDNLKTSERVNSMGEAIQKTYTPANDTTNWLMNILSSVTETSKNNITGETLSRTRLYTYYSGTLLPQTEAIQSAGANDVKSVITYTRGPGALGQVTQQTTTATSTADDTSVPTGTTLTRTTTTTYDAVDGVTVASIANALNQKTLFAYHGGFGVLAKTEDPNGVVTSFQYDGFGRPRKMTIPTAGDATTSYEAPPTFPSLISTIVSALRPSYAVHTTQVGGEETIVTYNINGNELVRQTKGGDGAYRYILSRYTSVPGQVVLVSLPFRSTDSPLRLTSFSYDSFGTKLQTTFPDGNKQTAFYTPRFGPLGYVKTVTNELNHTREETYNDDGQIVSVTEYAGATPITTTYEYGRFGLLKNISPPPVVSAGGTKSAGNSIAYDVLGRQTTYTEGNAGAKTRSYNAFGEVVKEVDATGIPTFFKRDALGRVTSRSNLLDGASANVYVWDTAARGTTAGALAIGKLASSTSFDGTSISYIYDAQARPSVTTWGIQGRAYQMKQTYTSAGKVSEIDYPTTASASTQLKVTYGYDSVGGVSSVTKVGSTTPYWKATRWWANGRIDQENDATNMVTTRAFDDYRSWPTNITTAAGSVTIQNVHYVHDFAGNVTRREDNDSAVSTTEVFGYDDTDKLSKWTFTSGSSTWTTDYAPGASGVIQQTKTGTGAQSLAYDYYSDAASQLPHAVRKVNTTMLSYDTKGRQTSTLSNLTPAYTSFDLPKTINNGATIASYKYDADNNRVYKSYSGQTTTSILGLYERRVNSSGAVTHVMYVRGPGNRVVAEENWAESGTSVTPSPVLYHHDDIIGSTVVTNTAATTASTTRLRYDPFGLRISPKNPTTAPYTCVPNNPSTCPPTKVGFTGHEMEDEFNLINMKGRIYDPKTARFLTPDPLVSAPNSGNGYDRYGYAGNNPMKYTDPSGFAMGNDPWLAVGYGEDFLDIWISFAVGKAYQEKRAAAEQRAADMQRKQMLAKAEWAYQVYLAAKQEEAKKLASNNPNVVAIDPGLKILGFGIMGAKDSYAFAAGQIVQWTLKNLGILPVSVTIEAVYGRNSQGQQVYLGPTGTSISSLTVEFNVLSSEPTWWMFNSSVSSLIPPYPWKDMPIDFTARASVGYTIRSNVVPDRK